MLHCSKMLQMAYVGHLHSVIARQRSENCKDLHRFLENKSVIFIMVFGGYYQTTDCVQ